MTCLTPLLAFLELACAALYDAVAFDDAPDGPKEAPDVHAEADAPAVVSVQLRLIGDLQLVSAVDLRQAGQARHHIVGRVCFPFRYQVRLVPKRRPGTDHAHLPAEDVPDLGELVKRAFPEESSGSGDILIRVRQQMGRHIMRRGHLHASELVQIKERLSFSHALLRKKRGTRIVRLDPDDQPQKQRAEKHQAKEDRC